MNGCRSPIGVPVRERHRDCPAERPAADDLSAGLRAGYPTVRQRLSGEWDYWAVAKTGFPDDEFAHGWALAEETLGHAEMPRLLRSRLVTSMADLSLLCGRNEGVQRGAPPPGLRRPCA